MLVERFPYDVVPWLINCFHFLSSVFLVLMLIKLCPDSTCRRLCHRCPACCVPLHRFKCNIRLISIVIFYLAILVFDVLRINAEYSCYGEWKKCTSRVITEHVADVLYSCLRIICLSVELVVCYKFNGHHLTQNTLLLLGLAFILATNLSAWLDALVDESAIFSPERNWTNEMWRCLNGTDVNVSAQSDQFIQCFRHDSSEYEMLNDLSPYLFPFIMEYLMLVIEFVADWLFSNAVREQADPMAINNGEHQQPQQGANAHVPAHVPQTRCDCVKTSLAYAALPTVTAFSLGFLILGVLSFWYDNENRVYLYVFMCYRSGYWLLLSLVALIGYAFSRRFPSERMNPKVFQYFVILSGFGPIVQSVLTTVGYLMSDTVLIPTGMFFTDAVTNIIQIFTQVVFYAHIKSIQIRAERELRDKRLLFVIWCFVVCNTALWIEDSFLETHNSETNWEKNYIDKWPIIYNIVNPLAIFFRFNSAVLFLNVLFDKQR